MFICHRCVAGSGKRSAGFGIRHMRAPAGVPMPSAPHRWRSSRIAARFSAVFGTHVPCADVIKAFSGKVGTGFPSKNALNQKLTAVPRFNKSGNCCSACEQAWSRWRQVHRHGRLCEGIHEFIILFTHWRCPQPTRTSSTSIQRQLENPGKPPYYIPRRASDVLWRPLPSGPIGGITNTPSRDIPN